MGLSLGSHTVLAAMYPVRAHVLLTSDVQLASPVWRGHACSLSSYLKRGLDPVLGPLSVIWADKTPDDYQFWG